MRTDIKCENEGFELSFRKSTPQYTVTLEWTKETDFAIHGTITLPYSTGLRNLAAGVGVFIPFRYTVKPVLVSFVLDGFEGHEELLNRKTNNYTFELLNTSGEAVLASYLPVYSTGGKFRVSMVNGNVYLSDYEELDLAVVESMEQNKRCLLECVPGNLYQHPTTGVGIFRYLNSNMERSGLGERIKSQFNMDGMRVESATIDQENNTIKIEAAET